MRTIPPMTTKQVVRFWSHVALGSLDECWPWTASINGRIGEVRLAKRAYSARAIAFCLHRGHQPPYVWITCKTPACCNPAHLIPSNKRTHGALVEERNAEFWALVDREEPDRCWLWLGGRYESGYGRFSIRGRQHGAHRIAFYLTFGIWPPVVMHAICDNPPCCNPAHLKAAESNAENVRDMHAKGRARFLCGEKINTAKLTADQVSEIRRRFDAGRPHRDRSATVIRKRNARYVRVGKLPRRGSYLRGSVTQTELAREYKVSTVEINAIVRGQFWTHVEGPIHG